ncbi:hypothetical protein SCLCIDRAFT_20413 [Scleroderma citrinum Foug A]|uniref:Uncharacterized protein n=1 Tax=Scleroderma citrinum Foug A TaxID=1036808 RepID=A0A0C3EKP2_9AGAM|nr:hypothetical protein SCLCIDRAFT_20413 [Scleroderma citrinum Foug A]
MTSALLPDLSSSVVFNFAPRLPRHPGLKCLQVDCIALTRPRSGFDTATLTVELNDSISMAWRVSGWLRDVGTSQVSCFTFLCYFGVDMLDLDVYRIVSTDIRVAARCARILGVVLILLHRRWRVTSPFRRFRYWMGALDDTASSASSTRFKSVWPLLVVPSPSPSHPVRLPSPSSAVSPTTASAMRSIALSTCPKTNVRLAAWITMFCSLGISILAVYSISIPFPMLCMSVYMLDVSARFPRPSGSSGVRCAVPIGLSTSVSTLGASVCLLDTSTVTHQTRLVQ